MFALFYEDGTLFENVTNDMVGGIEDFDESGVVFMKRELAEAAAKYWNDGRWLTRLVVVKEVVLRC